MHGCHDQGKLPPSKIKSELENAIYTCPMHPEVEQKEPGACPICGMALELRMITVETESIELMYMTRRFWLGVILTLPILILNHGNVYSWITLCH